MSDQIEALERLAQLRKDGVLSDAEFEQQKAQLLGGGHAAGANLSAALSDFRARFPATLKRGVILGIIAVVLIIAAVVLGARSSAGGWTFATEKDSMSDVTIQSALSNMKGNLFDVQLRISCGSNGWLAYEFYTFKPDGSGAELRQESRNFLAGGFVKLEVRRDSLPSQVEVTSNPKYSNFAMIEAQPVGWDNADAAAEGLARAKQVTVKLPGVSGDETIQFAQTDPQIRKMLDQCIDHRTAEREPIAAAEMAIERKASADRDAYAARVKAEDARQSESGPGKAASDEDTVIRRLPLIAKYEEANSACRGSTDPDRTEAICLERDRLFSAALQAGFCLGNGSEESVAEERWRRCAAPTTSQQ